MKKLQILIFLSVIILASSGPASASPRLAMPDSMFSFGFVPQNVKISHTFWLYSTGTDSLKIIKVSPGCGCTQAPLGKSDLGIGDSTALEIIFNTGHYTGVQSKRPGLLTNEGIETRYLQFLANVYTNSESLKISVKPDILDFSPYGGKEKSSQEFTVKNLTDEDVQMTLIDSPPGMFKVSYPKKLKPGETGKGKLEILKEKRGDEFEKSVTFLFNDKAKTRLTVPVKRITGVSGTEAGGVKAGK